MGSFVYLLIKISTSFSTNNNFQAQPPLLFVHWRDCISFDNVNPSRTERDGTTVALTKHDAFTPASLLEVNVRACAMVIRRSRSTLVESKSFSFIRKKLWCLVVGRVKY